METLTVNHKTEKGEILFVKVLDDSFSHWHNPEIKHLIHYHTPQLEGMSDIDVRSIELESNDWQLIGLTSEITEEQTKMIGLISVSNFRKEIEKLQVYEKHPIGDNAIALENSGEAVDWFFKMEKRTGKWLVLFKPE